MSSPRAARALLATLLSLLSLAAPRPAVARDGAVLLTLAGQTPWTTNEEPLLRVAVVVTNVSPSTLRDLTLELGMGDFFVSRFDYETSLTGDSSPAVVSVRTPIDGTIEPGQSRTLRTKLDLSSIEAVSKDESRVYPLRIQVFAAGIPAGSLGSAAIHLARTPEAPLLFTSWFELTSEPAFTPEGALVDPSLEAALTPNGALGAPLAGLRAALAVAPPEAAIDVVIQPSLLNDLARMVDGYARSDGTEVAEGTGGAAAASTFLAELREAAAAPPVQVIGLPYAGASWPALLGSGLESEARIQLVRSSQVIRGLLGRDPSTDVAQPTHGLLDDATIEWLARQGRTTILADVDEVERPVQTLDFAPPPAATFEGIDGAPTTTLVLPDPGTDELLHRADLLADPIRAAQVVLGELAVIWKERPVPEPPTRLGIALALPDSLPPLLWKPLLGRLVQAPFLQATHAQDLVDGIEPAGPPGTLSAPEVGAFSPTFAGTIRDARNAVNAYASMLVEPSDEPMRLWDSILRAEAVEYVGNESAGQVWIDSVVAVTSRAFQSTTPQVPQLFTFTSREGSIPLRLGDPGPTPLTVSIRLQSSQFDFPGGDTQTVVLEGPDQIVTFDVVAKASGRNPIRVVVFSPSGQEIDQQLIAVQTTVVSGIALGITVVAAAGLLALYARRWWRRRRT